MNLEFHQEHEKLFLNYLKKKPEYFQHIKPEFFEFECLDDLFKIIKTYYKEYKSFPTPDEIKILIKNSSYTHIPSSYADDIFKDFGSYSDQYAEEELKKWIKFRTIHLNVVTAAEYLQSQKYSGADPDYLMTKIRELLVQSPDFSDDLGLDFYKAEDHEIFFEDKISSGYKFYDELSGGGYDPETLVVYVGPPNIGKSIFLTNEASRMIQQGKNVLFITAEMSAKKCLKRIGSATLNIPLSVYDKSSKNLEYMQTKISEFRFSSIIDTGELKVVKVPTSKCTVNDIDSIIKRLEEREEIKFDCLIVDYINILADSKNKFSDNSYTKIKNISEDLRALADIHKLLVISATQTRRDGFNSSDITMEHIAESAALSHTADVLWAIIQTTEMYVNSYYRLKLLKTRDSNGKHTSAKINIDFETLKLDEEDGSDSIDDYLS